MPFTLERTGNLQLSPKDSQILIFWYCVTYSLTGWWTPRLLQMSSCSATSNGPKIFLEDSFTLAGTRCSSMPPLRHTRFLLRFSGPLLMLGPADTLKVPLADISWAPKLMFSLSLGEDTPPSVTLSPHLQRHSDMQSFIKFPWFNVVSHPVFVIALLLNMRMLLDFGLISRANRAIQQAL